MKKVLMCLVFVMAMILTAQSVNATIKDKSFLPVISYQAVVRSDNGTYLTDGKYPIVFKIYEDEKAKQEVWSEKQEINLTGGVINANIGSVSALKLPFDKQYWLGLSVNGEDYGRSPLSACAYSLHAKTLAEDALVGKNGIKVEKNKAGQLEISGQAQSGTDTKGLGWQPNYSDPNAQYTELNYNCGIGISTPNEKLTIEGSSSLRELATSPNATVNYGKVYTKTDKNLYYKNSSDVETKLNPTLGFGWLPTTDTTVQYTGINYKCSIGVDVPNEKLTVDGGFSLKEQATSLNTSTNYGKVYTKTDKNLYYKRSDGVESKLNDQILTDKVYVEYTIDTALPLQSFSHATWGTINYNKKVMDLHNAVTTGANWMFTAPRSGIYLIQGIITIRIPSGNVYQSFVRIDKNGVTNKYLSIIQSLQSNYGSNSYNAIIKMEAGDSINLKFDQASSDYGAKTIPSNTSYSNITIIEQ